MKKTYIEPKIIVGDMLCKGIIAASIRGDGLQMEINSSSVEGAADGRSNGSFWDEEN